LYYSDDCDFRRINGNGIMKLAIIVRKDLGMRTGKIAVQVGHACTIVTFEEPWESGLFGEWYNSGQKKIVLKADDDWEILRLVDAAIKKQLRVTTVTDLGLTQVEPNTLTCIAIGPDEDEKIDEITKGLNLL
jgi:peptidyl-tRNA hydrolase, PTH2 family